MSDQEKAGGSSTGEQIQEMEGSLRSLAEETDQALKDLSHEAESGMEDLRRAIRALSAEVRWQRQALNTLIGILKKFFGIRVTNELTEQSRVLNQRPTLERRVARAVKPGEIHEDYPGQALPDRLRHGGNGGNDGRTPDTGDGEVMTTELVPPTQAEVLALPLAERSPGDQPPETAKAVTEA